MTVGLRTRDAAGNIIVDSNYALSKELGSGTYSAASGSIVDANFASGRPYWIGNTISSTTSPAFWLAPTFSFNASTNTLSWTGGQTGQNMFITWGIY